MRLCRVTGVKPVQSLECLQYLPKCLILPSDQITMNESIKAVTHSNSRPWLQLHVYELTRYEMVLQVSALHTTACQHKHFGQTLNSQRQLT